MKSIFAITATCLTISYSEIYSASSFFESSKEGIDIIFIISSKTGFNVRMEQIRESEYS